jgi:transcriptional regulator with XRE-family HTH domain
MSTLAERIKRIMDARGWSGRELSRQAGLDESHINAIAAGRVLEPTRKTLVPIARCSGFSLVWLMTGDGPEQPYEEQPEDVDQYPSRTRAAEAARLMRLPEWAIVRVLSVNDHEHDPGQEYWFGLMQAEARRPDVG